MTVYKRGDIILVPFPFSDQTTVKKRPAVIISSDDCNNIFSDIVIMAITSQTEKAVGTGDCLIADWQGAGLLKPSAIKPAISTIEQTLVLKKLGRLSTKDLASMGIALKKFLGLQ